MPFKHAIGPPKHQARALNRLNPRRKLLPGTDGAPAYQQPPANQGAPSALFTVQAYPTTLGALALSSFLEYRSIKVIAPAHRPSTRTLNIPISVLSLSPLAPIDCCHSIYYQLYRLYALNTPCCAAICLSVKRQVLSPFTPSLQC